VTAEARQVYPGPVEAATAGASFILEDVRVR
jgi:hypothetical protein